MLDSYDIVNIKAIEEHFNVSLDEKQKELIIKIINDIDIDHTTKLNIIIKALKKETEQQKELNNNIELSNIKKIKYIVKKIVVDNYFVVDLDFDKESFLLKQVMYFFHGSANPNQVKELIQKELDSLK